MKYLKCISIVRLDSKAKKNLQQQLQLSVNYTAQINIMKRDSSISMVDFFEYVCVKCYHNGYLYINGILSQNQCNFEMSCPVLASY